MQAYKKLVIAIFLTTNVIWVCATLAATCRRVEPLAELFEANEHVFLARIVAAHVDYDPDGEIVELAFDLVETYKGVPEKVVLTTDSAVHVERSDFRTVLVGAHYVIFAAAAGKTHLGLCSNFRHVLYEQQRVSELVVELRKLAVDTT